jgi:hypothetical protein
MSKDRRRASLAALRRERDRLRVENGALRTTNEEGSEVIAELSTALAFVVGEELSPCGPPCAGHLGEKGNAALTEALARWAALYEELSAAREQLNSATEAYR